MTGSVSDPQTTPSPPARGWIWPVGIAVGLAIVILVNVLFAVVAVGGHDEVLSSYQNGDRWGGDSN